MDTIKIVKTNQNFYQQKPKRERDRPAATLSKPQSRPFCREAAERGSPLVPAPPERPRDLARWGHFPVSQERTELFLLKRQKWSGMWGEMKVRSEGWGRRLLMEVNF